MKKRQRQKLERIRKRESGEAKPEAQKRSKRKKQARKQPPADSGQLMRIRPYGPRGIVAMLVVGLILVGVVVATASMFGRVNLFGYWDSAWLYISLGGLIVSPGIGWVARSTRDVTIWAVLIAVLSIAALSFERLTSAPCAFSSCESMGAQGDWGVIAVALVIALSFAATLWVGTLAVTWLLERRGEPERGGVWVMTTAYLWNFVLLGSIMFGVFFLLDGMLRNSVSAAQAAPSAVMEDCFDYNRDDYPTLAVRPDPRPDIRNGYWYLVRIDGDTRTNPDGSSITDRPWRAEQVLPYEAVVGYSFTGSFQGTDCRFINPSTEQVTDIDLTPVPGAASYYPESDVINPPLDIIPVAGPPGDEEPPAEDGNDDAGDSDGDASADAGSDS